MRRTFILRIGSFTPPKEDSTIPSFCPAWKEYGILPRTIDVFHDGSVLLVDAPGHLPGHLNILARVEESKFVYLAGDACHDRHLLRGEKSHVCCIHIDKAEAEKTIDMVRGLEEQGVEVIFAHDIEWEENPENRERFFH
ncbi:uncharacterized protein N7483_003958 [Penicillium malachiteum]|uniref:uncharacterized protein n=1 Tax=Penicillium malachiteum TaxID=1324776 RepID=UPI002548C768|nr:uncharacterized protein N7483_003958 [Penicillium malachiteum]KAJ5729450.1 hypothetical protein N7483_003958 [Penicillium malachiteum]